MVLMLLLNGLNNYDLFIVTDGLQVQKKHFPMFGTNNLLEVGCIQTLEFKKHANKGMQQNMYDERWIVSFD